MANPEHLAILKQGVEVWNGWRGQNRSTIPDLSGGPSEVLDLRALKLRSVDFWRAYLDWVDFTDTDLTDAKFNGAWLRGTTFEHASLKKASLIYTNAIGANFRRTDLTSADLTRADCNGANFDRAIMIAAMLNETVLANANLANSTGLETCHHIGPSVLDHRTFEKSGRLPLAFLRGCGLPEQLIEYLPSLLNNAIQFYSCFISYSAKDQSFADRLHADLQNQGVRCWFATHDIQGGKKIHEQIDEAIRVYDRLLLILSDHSMNSEWVTTEIANARQRETREKRQMLFPISLVPYDRIKEWKAFDADTRQGLSPRDPRVLHPRFFQLEGP